MICYFFDLFQYGLSHTCSVCDNLVFLLLAEFLGCVVPKLYELGRNLATRRRTDRLKPCPMEDHLQVTMIALNVNQNPECRRCPI